MDGCLPCGLRQDSAFVLVYGAPYLLAGCQKLFVGSLMPCVFIKDENNLQI